MDGFWRGIPKPPIGLWIPLLAAALSLPAGADPATRDDTSRSGAALRSVQLASVSRRAWMWSSIPLDSADLSERLRQVGDHARIQWYNPHGVLRRDLNPLLTEEDGATRDLSVLEINVLNPPGGSLFTAVTWTGLTQRIPEPLRDFSANRYMEVWLNDRAQDHSLTHAVLHVDLGRVSEDTFWNPVAPPNGKLDTEDRNAENRLDVGEDTGLDETPDREEPGYSDTNRDPNGDDYAYDSNHPDDYSHINGTEGNGEGDPNTRPDTEDRNLNGLLDLGNDYFEASINLADTAFVAIDVARDYAGNSNLSPANGWRLFRIPIQQAAFRALGSPSWNSIEDCRLWLSDMAGPTNIQIEGISVVGEFPPQVAPRAVLHQNQPNPFNPSTTIPYELDEDGLVRLSVYDVHGRLVRELVNTVKAAGPHLAFWTGRDAGDRPVASGVYVYRLEAGGKSVARRMVLVR